ncbi:probable tRNA (uracil-O(2)-)-methyltransferase isoform X2 [Acipenser ruthenus]|uniref:probable tRNA (uracil-O(2)-)-methyltransferase isoform X2 n=1 Tax=Acipenser ruthenus TaxID=7906 RepID=UPI002741010F|nr:probable tRNA (uracil-O(2)-)-methyltransferase isoform X2 [Acipenser ruthenus]
MTKLSEITFKDQGMVSADGFWSAVDVWIHKPHVVNKRLCGAKTEEKKEVNVLELEQLLSGYWYGDIKDINSILNYLNEVNDVCLNQPARKEEPRCFILRSLIPKVNTDGVPFKREMVVKDVVNQRVTFLPLEENIEGHAVLKRSNIYQIQLRQVNNEEWSVSISTLCSEGWDSDGVIYPKLAWLSTELLSKLAKWSTENKRSEFKSTLSLIAVEKYSHLYQQLKEKYKEMVKVWPEVTDPEKFVYEDVAIATYLLVMWEEERKEKDLAEKQSFVDLGCGNGLLVHILSNEGHPGRGIDVRKRKIWDMYGPQTHLEECAITPSENFLFPDVDWLIGNHSDELTPWIPVMSSRSSYSCRFFVLPCCFFDFIGKYNRRQCKKTQYREYIDFIAEVASVCGFDVEEDCLRIPSTKRVCLVGKTRTYDSSCEAQIDEQRIQLIKNRPVCNGINGQTTDSKLVTDCSLGHSAEQSNDVDHSVEKVQEASFEPETQTCASRNWAAGFQPREKAIHVRNCASLPRNFIDRVVLQVANALLDLNEGVVCGCVEGHNIWNRGGSLSVREVAELLDKETLQNLKNECGGLQTLLKNNHQVFRVLGGIVQIRDWREETGGRKAKPDLKRKLSSAVLKTRLCWFFVNHPDGCPIPSESCLFAHGPEELRPSAFKSNKPHNRSFSTEGPPLWT